MMCMLSHVSSQQFHLHKLIYKVTNFLLFSLVIDALSIHIYSIYVEKTLQTDLTSLTKEEVEERERKTENMMMTCRLQIYRITAKQDIVNTVVVLFLFVWNEDCIQAYIKWK